jgi:hypothetical protein
MSSTESTFTRAYDALTKQSLSALKETQDYTVRVAELASDNPLARAIQTIPAPAALIDGTFAAAQQALDLQRDFVARLSSVGK